MNPEPNCGLNIRERTWTGPDGLVWDLSREYRDARGRAWLWGGALQQDGDGPAEPLMKMGPDEPGTAKLALSDLIRSFGVRHPDAPGYRTPLERYIAAVAETLTAELADTGIISAVLPPGHNDGVGISLCDGDATLLWGSAVGWTVFRRDVRRRRIGQRYLRDGIVPAPGRVAARVRVWLDRPGDLSATTPHHERLHKQEMDERLLRAAGNGDAL